MNRWALPLFLTRENKYPYGTALYFFAAAIYLVANHFHFTPPQLLERSALDISIPFIPETIWIYLSEYALFVMVFVMASNLANLNKFLYSFLCMQLVSCAIFWIYPTTYPRDLFPVPDDVGMATRYAFISLRETDTPANCCPSLHVSSVFLSAFLYIDEQRKYFLMFLVWGLAIAASTLTTKQHYAVDVVAGIAIAVVHYFVFHRWARYDRAPAPRQAD